MHKYGTNCFARCLNREGNLANSLVLAASKAAGHRMAPLYRRSYLGASATQNLRHQVQARAGAEDGDEARDVLLHCGLGIAGGGGDL